MLLSAPSTALPAAMADDTSMGGHLATRAAEQRAPPSAAACIAGRKTEGPLYGAAAPGGGGRTGLDAEQADAAEHLPQPLGLSLIHI